MELSKTNINTLGETHNQKYKNAFTDALSTLKYLYILKIIIVV
jgi:hypothetical protein